MLDSEDMDLLINNLNTELTRIMDTLAPAKEVMLLTHERQPWYDDQVKAQHKIVRNREHAWKIYKLETC